MFVRDTQQQFRISNADVKMFYGTSGQAANPTSPIAPFSWNKPSGVSFIYMLLIGAGGGGDSSTLGGGSGGVTCWFGAARHIPDSLIVSVGVGVYSYMADTTIRYRTSSTTLVNLLTAYGASGTAGGTTSNSFYTPLGALGFYNSYAGQAGQSGAITPDTINFLTGGAASAGTGNWGYRTDAAGMFQLQPVIFGNGGVDTGKGGIGCGGGIYAGAGGPGMALIASW